MPIYTHPLDGSPRFPTRLPSDTETALRTLSSRYREQSNWTATLTNSKDLAEWINNSKPKVTLYRASDVKFLFDELLGYKNYVGKLKKTWKGFEPDVDAVWRMDGLLDKVWKKKLMDAASTLASVPKKARGWPTNPPKSAVEDLIDPSMYALIYGQTLALKNGEFSQVALSSPNEPSQDHTGCWLPSEFIISEQGTSTKISSYINNLTLPGQDVLFHPILEKAFTKMLPLFDHALADLAGGGCSRNRSTRTVSYTIGEDDYIGDYCSDDEGPPGNAWTPPKIVASRMLRGKTVNVVVRMLEVKLSANSPVYQAAEPYIDGLANERIIATGMYLYAKQNVTDVSIEFKLRDFYPDREEIRNAAGVEGLLSRRDVGTTSMKENRAIVFPNVYEKRILPFQLQNRKRYGFVKILCFHLCDPTHEETNKMLQTTRTVPPQQPGQFEQILRDTKQLGKLPEEIFQSILGYCVGTILPVKKAMEYKDLMVGDREHMMRWGVNYDSDENYDEPIIYNDYEGGTEYGGGGFDDFWF
ncbi:hypothetical protein TWF506_000337 [Arthrobotrys conoides]|uniref:DUF4246 domain-containing protein n=1 Tax=Arthrobotrys conoides TaxID=74498 RepID=A0AAN8PQN0_9PEZI